MARKFLRALCVALIVLLPLMACAPVVAQPTATPQPAVQATATPAPAQPMILVLPAYGQRPLIAVNRHYSSVLKNKGWNIDFYTVQQDYSDDGTDSYLEYVTAQLAAGVAKADGYFLYGGQTENTNTKQTFADLRSKGLLFDCAAAAQQAVPDYWARWKDRIANSPYGLPLCREIISGAGYTLCVRQDTLGEVTEPLNTFSDIRALVERLAGPAPKNGAKATARSTDPVRGGFRLSASFQNWLDCWALEQGYMAINESAFVYAGIDDANAQPVLLEDIPGFQAFLDDYLNLRSRGVLYDATNPNETPGSPGNALLLQTGYLYQPGLSGFALQDYTAYPLYRGGRHAHNLMTALVRQHADSLFGYVLTIPAASRRAADAMAFVQWAAASQENGDALLYGQQGEDYTLQGERIVLSETMRDVIDGGNLLESNSGAFAFFNLFGGFAQRRIPVEAPRNAEDVLAVAQPQQLDAPWLTDLLTYRLPPYSISDMPPDNLIQSRNNDTQAFFSLLYDSSSVLPTADELMKGFHGKDSAALLQWYQQRVDRARAKAGQ